MDLPGCECTSLGYNYRSSRGSRFALVNTALLFQVLGAVDGWHVPEGDDAILHHEN